MSPSTRNPYPQDSSEHDAWDRWHRAYFAQPVSGQFYEVAALLRSNAGSLRDASAELMPREGRQKLRIHIYALEGIADLVQECAERADGALGTAEPSPD
jgi:hypothetical protein